MRSETCHRCVLLFALPARQEARSKRLTRVEALFDYARRRVSALVAGLPGVDLLILPQRGSGFGERLENAFADARGLGYREIVVVPGDVPRLGTAQLARAFALLAERSVVLGPSPDGGIYLLGLADAIDSGTFLAGVRWRGTAVFADLAGRSGAPGVLEILEDLDRPADLGHLLKLARRRGCEPDLARLLSQLRLRTSGLDISHPAPRRLALSSRLLTRGPPASPLPH